MIVGTTFAYKNATVSSILEKKTPEIQEDRDKSVSNELLIPTLCFYSHKLDSNVTSFSTLKNAK